MPYTPQDIQVLCIRVFTPARQTSVYVHAATGVRYIGI